MSESIETPGNRDAACEQVGDDGIGPARAAVLAHVERPMCPLPEVAVLLDEAGRILTSGRHYAGPRLERLEFLPGSNMHDILHPRCADEDCHFVADWQSAWDAHGGGLPIEWLYESTAAGGCLKLRLQTVGYLCSELYGEALCDFDDCTVLFIQDMSALDQRQRVVRSASRRKVAAFPLRRATDPHPDLVESLDSRLRNVTRRMLIAHEAERKRIAAELHDCLGQTLSLLRWEVEALLQEEADDDDADGDYRARTVRLYRHSRRALDELRAIVSDLRPTLVNDRGLPGALEVLCDDFRSMPARTSLRLDISGDARSVDERIAIAVYRIAQEALNNVLRHADAKHASVEFAVSREAVTLVVADDGCGLPQGQPPRRGLGLITMRERAESLGGTFEIETRAGEGCTLRIRWPLD